MMSDLTQFAASATMRLRSGTHLPEQCVVSARQVSRRPSPERIPEAAVTPGRNLRRRRSTGSQTEARISEASQCETSGVPTRGSTQTESTSTMGGVLTFPWFNAAACPDPEAALEPAVLAARLERLEREHVPGGENVRVVEAPTEVGLISASLEDGGRFSEPPIQFGGLGGVTFGALHAASLWRRSLE